MDNVEQVAQTEDMFIDTENFDFTQLDDIVSDSNELGYNTKQTGKDLMSKEEISDLESEGEEEVDDLPDYEDDDGEEDTDDLPPEDDDEDEENTEPDEDKEGDGEGETEEQTDEEVDYENYELTLPTGETVVLSELVSGYKDRKALEEERAQFEQVREEFTAKSADITSKLELSILEADKVIEDYKDFDWEDYRKNDPVGYVENREFLDRYIKRREEIVNEYNETKKAEEERAAAEFQAKAKEANTILARDIPGWNNELYQQLMMYAVENGAEASDIANTVDPMVFKLLHKAMQFDKGKSVVKAKVRKLGAPKKVVKAEGKTTTAVKPGKTALIKRLDSADVSERDISNAFSFLED